MTKKRYAACILVIAAAIITIVLMLIVDHKGAVNDPAAVTEKIESILPPQSQGTKESRYYTEMPMMNIDGSDYVGILQVPSGNIKLPVYSHWDENYAMSVPCRYSGSVYNNDLIIGGKNDNNNLGFVTYLNVGDTITFTDMLGRVYSYKVASIYHKTDYAPEESGSDDGLLIFSYLSDASRYIFVACK